ncbi:DUF2306 domain-containing protein [Amycolatopsis taiwanensis]|uniref:DUF2306 domain-containing protein n=1 Tax=Amycolatopsis taiwanensis TaxID=342230 RepID=A0A9W6R1X1_9PSEU|nr:DUF2306 domain-containing protein [Amycolatopsis taiwanensis]GLY68021.1 hypothetical protein Atai01_46400 [Amycolatopsis taiwanensis]
MRRPTAWLLLIVAIVFSAVLTYPYLSLDIDNSRLDVRDSLHYSVLVVHIFTATVALVLGPLQFIPKVRARKRIHRTLGRVYLLAGVLPSAVATIPVAMWSGRTLTQIGLTTAAVLWLITGGLAYRAARRRDFSAHRAWMMRNYALTFLAVTSRILIPVFLLLQIPIPFGGTDAGSNADRATSMIPIGQTLGWIINLIVVEFLIRRASARRKPPSRPDLHAEDKATR